MDSLTHYGVKGMHWGIRNGPPYPIDRSSFNRRREFGSLILLNKKEKTDETVKQAKDVRQVSSLKKKYGEVKTRDPDSNMKEINPDGGDTNCVMCSVALVTRVNHGISVKARRHSPVSLAVVENGAGLYERLDGKTFSASSREGMERKLLQKYADGDNGIVNLFWPGNKGHTVAWFIEDGSVVYRDAQLTDLKKRVKRGEYGSGFDYLIDMPDVLKTNKDKDRYFKENGLKPNVGVFYQMNTLVPSAGRPKELELYKR